MSRLVTLVLLLFTLFLTITAQDVTPTPTSDPSSTAGAGDGDTTPTPTPTPTVPSSDTGSATTTPPTSTVTVSSSSSSTGTTSNGTSTNTTVPPTATPTSTPTTAPSTETGRAACPGNDAFTEALKNDLPPWNCPRLDVDGGALGPRNNYDPCRSLTLRLGAQRNGTVTIDQHINYVCTRAPVAGLNSSKAYVYSINDPKKSYSLPTLVTKGDVYPVAIVTSNVLFNKKMIFQPLVDSFTSLEIAASHGVQWFSVPNTYISLEAGGLTSGPRSRIFRIPGLDKNGIEGETMAQNYWQNPKEGIEWRKENHYGIVPFWTVLINADNGRITSITWDEGCDACADQECSSDGNCGVDEYSCALVNGTTTRAQNDTETLPEYDIRQLSDCARDAAANFTSNSNNRDMTWDPIAYARVRAIADSCIASKQIRSNTQSDALSMVQAAQKRIPQTPPAGGNTDCGIKIYLGWTGTDQNGKFFTSAGKRLSVFRKYSIGAAFNSASQYVDQQLPEAPTEDAGPGDFEG